MTMTRQTEKMGTENNTVGCGVTGAMLFIDLNEGKEGNKNKDFNVELGKAAGLTARMIEGSAGCGQPLEREGETNGDWYCFDAKFALFNTIRWMVDNGKKGILNVKQYHHGFPKNAMCTTLKKWPRGSYLVATHTLPSRKKMCFIGYKWNHKKTFYFAFTEDAGSTK